MGFAETTETGPEGVGRVCSLGNLRKFQINHADHFSQAHPHQAWSFANMEGIKLVFMLPPFCSQACSPVCRRQHLSRKLQMLRFWRDGAERQLAALNASIDALHRQIERDRSEAADPS